MGRLRCRRECHGQAGLVVTVVAGDGHALAKGDAGPDAEWFAAPGAVPQKGLQGEVFLPLPDPQPSAETHHSCNPRGMGRDHPHQGSQNQPSPKEDRCADPPPDRGPGMYADQGRPRGKTKKVQGPSKLREGWSARVGSGQVCGHHQSVQGGGTHPSSRGCRTDLRSGKGRVSLPGEVAPRPVSIYLPDRNAQNADPLPSSR